MSPCDPSSAAGPRWLDYPLGEYERRLRVAREAMSSNEIDLVLCTQRENVEYFSGFMTDHWLCRSFPTAAVILSRDHDPVLVIPSFFTGNAAETCWFADRETFDDPHANPRGFTRALTAALDRLGGHGKRIGVESGQHLMPTWNSDDLDAFRSQFGHSTVSAADVIWSCRAIKSQVEIDRFTALSEAASRAIGAARQEFRPGMTERQIAHELARAGVEHGTEGLRHVNLRAGLDRYKMADTLPQERPIQVGEMLLVDVGFGHRSFVSDNAYVSHVGRATDRHHREYSIVLEAQAAGLAAMRPGTTASDVYAAVIGVLSSSGLRTIDMCGHGIGLDVHEPPMLTPTDHTELRTGMLLALEPWLYDTDGMGYFCVEEHVLVTDTGARLLSTLDRNVLHEIL